MKTQTIIDKIWQHHVVKDLGDGRAVMHIDRHLIHEGTTRRAFDGLRKLGAKVRRPEPGFAVIDDGVSTSPARTAQSYEPTLSRNLAMRDNYMQFGMELFDISDFRQGIVHR